MKITENGVALLVAIEMARKEKKTQKCDLSQLALLASPKLLSLERFIKIFPLEEGVAEGIVALAKSLDKSTIDERTVALFFGGDDYARYVVGDICDKGFRNGPAMALLIFRVLLPVKIQKRKDGNHLGFYENNGVEIRLTHLQLLCENDKLIETGSMFFVRYGYIIRACEKRVYGPLLEEQSTSSVFFDACTRVGDIDCRKIISPLHFVNKVTLGIHKEDCFMGKKQGQKEA